jgi:hypothetical protein
MAEKLRNVISSEICYLTIAGKKFTAFVCFASITRLAKGMRR